MQIQTVFLDAGGVLVNPNWERVSECLCKHGVSVDSSRLREAEPIVKKSLDTEEIIRSTNDGDRFEQYLRRVIGEAGVIETDGLAPVLEELHDYNSRWNIWENVYPDVLPTLAALRSMGFQLAVLSNANGTLRQSLDRIGLLTAVDFVFDSYEEGIEKPNPEYFLRALSKCGGNPGTTIHIGDFYHVDVVGARSAGIHPILLDSANLYTDCDCPRIQSMGGVIDILEG